MNTYKFLIILIFSFLSFSQDYKLDNWNLYSSYREANDGALDSNGNIWVATSGGIFSFSPSSGSFSEYNFVNGLTGVNYTAIEYIQELDAIVAGSSNGTVSTISSNGNIQNIGDIRNSADQNKIISSIAFHNGITYIAYGSGLAEMNLNPTKSELEQTVGDAFKVGNVNKVLVNGDELWISTTSGEVLSTIIGNVITDPSNWEKSLLNAADPIIRNISIYNNVVYVGTADRIYTINENEFTPIFTYELDFVDFVKFDLIHNQLYTITNYGYEIIEPNQRFYSFGYGTVNFAKIVNDVVYYFTTEGGLVDYQQDQSFFPNSISSNIVFDIDVTNDNEVWVTSGTKGTSRLIDDSWTIFNEFKDIWGNDLSNFQNHLAIELTEEKDVFVGIKGPGQLFFDRQDDGSYQYRIYNDTNSTFKGIFELPAGYQPRDEVDLFTEAGDTKIDRNGVIWTSCAGDNTPGNVLVANRNGEFFSFAETSSCLNLSDRTYYHLAIDDFGTKWVGSDRFQSSNGLVLFNENGTLDDPSDDICARYSTRDIPNLANSNVKCITTDQNGWVWVGTSSGLTYFLNPQAFTYSNDPDDLIAVAGDEVLDDVIINDILVDPRNNKWLATNKGVRIVDEEATQILQFINSGNSPLNTDNINAIDIIEETGEVLIGTNEGLYSVSTEFTKPLDNFDFEVYPQPFNLNTHNQLIIDGLAPNAEVKIISTNGNEIFTGNALGRSFTWNGRTATGSKVKSGIYFVVGVSESTNSDGVTKIAVINK